MRELKPQEIGAIISAVKRGSSYSKQARIFELTKPRVQKICEKAGVRSKYRFGGDRIRRTFLERLLERLFG